MRIARARNMDNPSISLASTTGHMKEAVFYDDEYKHVFG